ncbi:At-rich interactive domain-containing protein 2-like [Thalictrum thalictroides]|uniref:At-rich interactive domain-containing protein 2-like n=1 Tax=Thalictrum thalictroides TaxID=46969 RepID=A0A7J6VX41_THATH|nr:At-rich interactive domain-containing protein 2-like [Thalictrum thalictroides]
MDISNGKPIEFQEMLLRLKCAAIKPGNTNIWYVMRKRLLATRKMLFLNYKDIHTKKRKHDQVPHGTGSDPLLKIPKRSKLLQLIDLISSVDPLVENFEKNLQIPCSKPSQGGLVDKRDASGSCIPDGDVDDHSSNGSKKLVLFKPDPSTDGAKRLGGGLQNDKSNCQPILISDDSADCSHATNHCVEVALRPEYPDEQQSIEPAQSKSKGTPKKNEVSRDHSVRNGIPTSNRFQEDITNSTGPESFDYNLDSTRGLGTQIWSREETNPGWIDKKGSDSSSSSDNLDTTEVIKHHPKTSDGLVLCCDLQTNVTISPISEDEPTPRSSSKPDKTTFAITISDDAADCPSTSNMPYNPQGKVATRSSLQDESKRILNFMGDGTKRDVIPIGKRFQADIPNLVNPQSLHYNLDSSKWLGTKIWPTKSGNMDNEIGKGRSDSSCYCDNPDSTECIQHHIYEERSRIQSEIGDAFYSWGFDKMGETVSASWTLDDQNRFAKLFKKKTTSTKQSFWSRACKSFPFKCRESMVSYYFNVFVLRNVRRQVRSQSPVIDSDDDEADDGTGKPKASKRMWLR